MNWEEREKIFAKEILTIKDIMALFNISTSLAAEKIRYIRSKSDRLGISGACHLQDYLDCYGLSTERYLMPRKIRAYEEQSQEITPKFIEDVIKKTLIDMNNNTA